MAELPNQYLHGYYKQMSDVARDPKKMKEFQNVAMAEELGNLGG